MNLKTKHWVLIIVGILVLIIIPVSAFYGYKAYLAPKTKTQTVTPKTEKEEPAISSKEDLSKAVDELNEVDTSTKQDESSLKQLVQ